MLLLQQYFSGVKFVSTAIMLLTFSGYFLENKIN